MDDLTKEQRKRLDETETSKEGMDRLIEDIKKIETEDSSEPEEKIEMENPE